MSSCPLHLTFPAVILTGSDSAVLVVAKQHSFSCAGGLATWCLWSVGECGLLESRLCCVCGCVVALQVDSALPAQWAVQTKSD